MDRSVEVCYEVASGYWDARQDLEAALVITCQVGHRSTHVKASQSETKLKTLIRYCSGGGLINRSQKRSGIMT